MSDSDAPAPTSAPRCPRQARRQAAAAGRSDTPRVTFADLHEEPFRLFFPAAVLAGLVGVLLWPLVLSGWMTDYPGLRHARLMIQGFFGGFLLGFLGTAFPRLVETAPLPASRVFPLLALFLANVVTHTLGATALGDGLFVAEIAVLAGVLGGRLRVRRDLPPPSFVLVGLGVACAVAGIVAQTSGARAENATVLEPLGRLWSYHAFILLCILGAGGFLLPRFLGLGARRKFETSIATTPEWRRAVAVAGSAGLLIVASYPLEAAGWTRWAGTLRALTMVAYLWNEMPLERLRWSWSGVQWFLIVGLGCLPLGVLTAAWLPDTRVGLSHIELITGFGLITLGVGTRVVFGHSGEREQLDRFQPWLTTAGVLLFLAMLSRVSGDFLPKSTLSHYVSAAWCWIAGVVIWAVCVLPKILRADREG